MITDLVSIKRTLMREWDATEKRHRDSGDDWYVGVMSGLEVAINKVDLMIEHEDDDMAKEYGA